MATSCLRKFHFSFANTLESGGQFDFSPLSISLKDQRNCGYWNELDSMFKFNKAKNIRALFPQNETTDSRQGCTCAVCKLTAIVDSGLFRVQLYLYCPVSSGVMNMEQGSKVHLITRVSWSSRGFKLAVWWNCAVWMLWCYSWDSRCLWFLHNFGSEHLGTNLQWEKPQVSAPNLWQNQYRAVYCG